MAISFPGMGERHEHGRIDADMAALAATMYAQVSAAEQRVKAALPETVAEMDGTTPMPSAAQHVAATAVETMNRPTPDAVEPVQPAYRNADFDLRSDEPSHPAPYLYEVPGMPQGPAQAQRIQDAMAATNAAYHEPAASRAIVSDSLRKAA